MSENGKPKTKLMKVAFTMPFPIGKVLVSPERPSTMNICGGRSDDGLYIWVELRYGKRVMRTQPLRVSTLDKLTPEEMEEAKPPSPIARP